MSLLAPAFLAGLLAIGIPLWLHRLSSDNPNKKPFSSIMFLEAGEPQRVLARKLQYLLLLAFRIGVLAALVLAFVQPAFRRDPAAGAAGQQQLHVVVLDTSASMAAGDRWDEAVDAATDVIDSIPVADPVQLIAAGRVLEVVTSPTLDKALARQSLASIEPGVFHVDFGQMTRALDGVLRGAELPVVLDIVTDAQAGGVPARFAELAPAEPARIVVHAVTDATEPNWTVESLFGSAETGELSAIVASHAGTAVDKALQLELNGTVVDKKTVSLEPGARTTVGFDPLELAKGANRVSVRLTPGDSLDGDDQRMLALNRPEPHPVLVVSGQSSGTEDTLFLTTTMRILEGLALEPKVVNAVALPGEKLDGYELVVVADAAALNSGDAERLRAYVENGGGLLLALGPRSPKLGMVPVTGHEFASQGSRLSGAPADAVAVGDVETGHPALAGLDTIRAARYRQYAAIVEMPDDDVLMRLQTGDPLLIEHDIGHGRLMLYTSSLDREWNDLPKEPVFVPFVAGIVDHLLGGAGFTSEAPLGSTLALEAMGMSGGRIFDPGGKSVLGLGSARADVLLDKIGFYELVGGGSTQLVAVNFDTRESDLAPAPEATLMRWQGLGLGQGSPAAGASEGAVTEKIEVPIGYWLLLLVILAAIVESGLGNWHLRVRRGIAA